MDSEEVLRLADEIGWAHNTPVGRRAVMALRTLVAERDALKAENERLRIDNEKFFQNECRRADLRLSPELRERAEACLKPITRNSQSLHLEALEVLRDILRETERWVMRLLSTDTRHLKCANCATCCRNRTISM